MPLDSDDHQLLAETYQAMYPEKHMEQGMVSEMCRKDSSVILAGGKIGSTCMLESRSIRSARVMASWADHDDEIKPTAAIRPGFLKCFVVSTIRFEEDIYRKHVFACVNCYKEDSQRELYRRPLEIWKLKTFNQPGPANFMPVQRCHCKFAAAYEKINGVKKQIVCPIQRTFC